MGFIVPADYGVELKENEKRDNYLDLARELKKKTTVEHVSDIYTNCNQCVRYSHQKNGKETGGFGNNHVYQPLRSGRIWHKVNF